MPDEPQANDLAAEVQELRQEVQTIVAAFKEFLTTSQLGLPLPNKEENHRKRLP